MMETWRLYYDGGCNLCHTSKLRVETWAQKAHQPLEVDVLQSDEAIAKGYGDAMVLEADGKVYFAQDAWLRCMQIAPFYLRWISWLKVIPGFTALAKFGYSVVAKYRIKWFGSRACQIPIKKNPTA